MEKSRKICDSTFQQHIVIFSEP